jgi:hypothetical protein
MESIFRADQDADRNQNIRQQEAEEYTSSVVDFALPLPGVVIHLL